VFKALRFLIYRVELKAILLLFLTVPQGLLVSNLPCGVERDNWQYRLRLKAFKFLIYRVELKGVSGGDPQACILHYCS